MNAFVDDIRGQGAALRGLLGHADEIESAAAKLDLASYDRIVLSGMGGSHHAAYPAWLDLVDRGLPAWWIETSELLHHAGRLVDGRTLLWLTSQSGESAEIVELLRAIPRTSRPTIVGLTNTPSSSLGGAADQVIELRAGAEHAVSTKTYVNTLGALALALGPPGAAAEIEPTAAALDRWAASLDSATERARALLDGARSLVVVGRGASLAAAGAGALTIKEAAKTHAEALGAGAFRHGPVELAGPDLTVVLLAGDEDASALNRALAEDVAGYGSRVLWIGENRPDAASPLLCPEFSGTFGRCVAEIAALQACSLALADLRSVEPGVFRYASKVTTIQ
jgi:glucosamine--fructose-6-phosphate aminotransferase (isomerizing)